MALLLVLLLTWPGARADEVMLTGHHFQDNLLEERFGPENGYTSYTTGSPIPDQVGVLR